MMKKRDEILLWNRFKNLNQQEDNPHFLSVTEELGIPYKRAKYLVHKWSSDNVLVEWGVSWRACWITPLGEYANIGLYGFDYDVDPEEYEHGY